MNGRHRIVEKIRMKNSLQFLALSAVLGIALVGCAPPEEPVAAGTAPPVPPVDLAIDAAAGVPVTQAADEKMLVPKYNLASRRYGSPRSDPFSLRSDEKQFETQQNTERVLTSIGGFTGPQFEPKGEVQAAPLITEPQPYRRLAGVVVGDSVLALIDMGNGTTELVRPGQKIPGTEWTVVSIDEEKAILRRGGNRLPRQVTVRLELPPPGMGGAPTGGFPGGPGGPPSGVPGGPPGGFPGGPPGGRPGANRPGANGPGS
jgi:hypothetical protein